ncbi:MAG TPA: amidohydrolase family protein, partial [Candidatus Syntrophosphaera thermopropionivorans]|nr:amidohydrolase family protein [Candidatus Syntrophosphaera thermopropionivorans]
MIYLYNAHIYHNAKFDAQLSGLLIDKDRIVKLCFNNDKVSHNWEKINLNGAYVYPGFIDAHTHCFSGGLYLSGIDLSECTSIKEVLEHISNSLKNNQQYIFAWRFDEEKIAEKRFPNRQELNSVCPDRPLLLRRIDGHSCVLNSKARAIIPGLKSSNEILIAEDNDRAVNWLQDNLSEAEIIEAYKNAAQAALKGGFTTVHTMIGDAQMSNQHYKLVRDHLNEFPVSFELYPQSFNIRDALKLGAKRIGGCILADGSIGSHTAAMTIPYKDKNTRGILYHNDEFWQEFVAQAHKEHLQVAVHCIGDAAIHQINSAYATQDREEVKELRDELIHCEVTPDSLIQEIAKSGAVAVMQPAFDL